MLFCTDAFEKGQYNYITFMATNVSIIYGLIGIKGSVLCTISLILQSTLACRPTFSGYKSEHGTFLENIVVLGTTKVPTKVTVNGKDAKILVQEKKVCLQKFDRTIQKIINFNFSGAILRV